MRTLNLRIGMKFGAGGKTANDQESAVQWSPKAIVIAVLWTEN